MELSWKVRQVIAETADTNTYVLEPADNDAVPYKAGQFLTFLFFHNNRAIRRSYSFSSTPRVDAFPAVTIKQKKNGEISRYIFETWKEGNLVKSIQPAGLFTVETGINSAYHYFFIAAGSGIVPVFSLLKQVLYFDPLSSAVLIYQNNSEQSIIFDKALHELEKQFHGRFRRVDLISNPIQKQNEIQRLSNSLLEVLVSTHYNTESTNLFYTCGPELFMAMVQYTVRLMGFGAGQVRKENFTIDKIPVPAFTMDTTKRMVTIQSGNEQQHFPTSFPNTILQSALDNDIQLPYSCRAGRCSACIARCIKGSVKMSRNEVLTEQDLDEGLVLTCVGYAETDVVLSLESGADSH